jgi:RHS repeat-associated protein
MQPTMTRAMFVLVGLLAMVVPAWAQAPPAAIEYYHLDAVGSVRAVTNQSGQILRRHDYFPFGEGDGVTQGNDPLRFTGKERDAETGLDYFGARYYAQRTGRFTTVDPKRHADTHLGEPQRWNRYSYALNNPISAVDPDGRDGFYLDPVRTKEIYERNARIREGIRTFLGGNGSAAHPHARVGQLFVSALDTILSLALPQDRTEQINSINVQISALGGGLSGKPPLHHIATNKNSVSTAAGGPYTPLFEAMFKKAGLSLDDTFNKIRVPGHQGPHAEYNRLVYERLVAALRGLKGDAYRVALEKEITAIGVETAKKGTLYNRLTGGS